MLRLRGPALLTLLCAIPVVLWLQSVPLEQRFDGTYARLTSIAVLLALTGTASFALNLVLGARLRFVERLFGGLDRMYRAHRLNGEIAFALLLGHAVLIVAGRATVSDEAALDVLQPGAGWTVFSGVLAFSAMTVAILLTLFARLGHELFVYVQRSFGIVFLVASYHVFTTPGAKQGSTALTVYLSSLATAGIAAFVYRSLLGRVLVRRRRYRVAAVNRLDERVTEIVMEPRGKPLRFEPGQFVFVNFRSPAFDGLLHPLDVSLRREVLSIRAGDAHRQFHPFSITSAPAERKLRVTVKAVGDYTRALRQLEPGADAVVEGAFGSFSHRGLPARRQIWAAGGIGVTPFLSMARSLNDDERLSVDFYYCVEHEAEAHFLDELRGIEQARAGFRVVLVARDRDGLLTGGRLAREHHDLAATEILICGPPAMIESLRGQLVEHGVSRGRIHAEEFGFANVDRPRTARPAPVVPARQTDRRMLAAIGAIAFAGPALAIAVVVGSYAAAQAL